MASVADPVTFVGRERELAVLRGELEPVRSHGAGRLILIEGRRQVGKSRLVEEYLERAGVPHVFFAATRGRVPALELRAFAEAVPRSEQRGRVPGARRGTPLVAVSRPTHDLRGLPPLDPGPWSP